MGGGLDGRYVERKFITRPRMASSSRTGSIEISPGASDVAAGGAAGAADGDLDPFFEPFAGFFAGASSRASGACEGFLVGGFEGRFGLTGTEANGTTSPWMQPILR